MYRGSGDPEYREPKARNGVLVMGTARKETRGKHQRRPRKTGAAKKQRIKVQKRRLIALGVPAEKVNKLDNVQIRALLKRPNKIKK